MPRFANKLTNKGQWWHFKRYDPVGIGVLVADKLKDRTNESLRLAGALLFMARGTVTNTFFLFFLAA